MATGLERRSGWVARLAGACLLAGQAWSALAAPVPPALEPWRDWVLHGYGESLCTPLGGGTRCLWPGELALDVDDGGARFTQVWTLQATQRVPLPGSGEWRPVDVRADGVAVPVLDVGAPMLLLEAGTHRVEGRIPWTQRPASLPVPSQVALLSLRVDGVEVPVPERSSDDEVVLGAAGAGEADALQLETYRLLADGVPQLLATQLSLSVSGKPREQVIGPVLPDGFVPVLVDGEVPARIEGNRLRVQLRAGQWDLLLLARATVPAAEFRKPVAADGDVLPPEEIWQFRDDPNFRIAQVTGVPGIDVYQIDTPDWSDLFDSYAPMAADLFGDTDALPAYILGADAVATLDVKLRGLPAERASRLSLERRLWLDFDGEGYLAEDTIDGELGSAQRLDMQAPWTLERALLDGDTPQLVTQGGSAQTGVEVRDPHVSLVTGARAARGESLPANGWTHAFDSASATLHLPPGYRLLGATGADRAVGSWWDAWSLLDIFLLSLFALMAFRLGGLPMGAALVAWVLLAWHEPLAPRFSLFGAVALSLLLRHLPPGRLARVTGWIRNALLVLAALLVLPFAAAQLRLALHPQLEHDSTDEPVYYSKAVETAYAPEPQQAEMVMAPPPPPPAPSAAPVVAEEDSSTLDRIEVTGSRVRKVDLLSYPVDTIPQAGSARPDWAWQNHALQWTGPLDTDTALGLVISPPWMTRAWRVLTVLLIGFIVLRVARPRGPVLPRARAAATPLVLLAALGTLPSAPAQAQSGDATIPTPDLLSELRDRLLARNEACRPDCGGLGSVVAIADGDTLTLQLDAQVQADSAWPLPRADASLQLDGVRVDGLDAPVARIDGAAWIALDRGVHRVEARYRADGERWRVAFPLRPAAIDVRADGFELAGIDEGRLLGDTLDLVPPRRIADTGEAATQAPDNLPPFVRVVRSVTIGQQWEIYTRVMRIAPQRGGITVPIALMPGEQVHKIDPEGPLPPVRNGQMTVSLPAGESMVTWSSRIVPAETLVLTAGDGRSYAEEWHVLTQPLLHTDFDGVPEAGKDEPDADRRFLPLPGEVLNVRVTRPAAVEGASIAIEDVALRVEPGRQARDSTLSFSLRATRAGQHAVQLPADAELLGFSIDGNTQPLLLDAGRVTLPLRTEPQSIELRWREPIDAGTMLGTPAVALGASAANIAIELQVPQDRWLLLTHGPRVGPAVLFWSGLAAILLVAIMLARLGGTPLRLHDWLLLGLGFSALSWWPAALVAGWLLIIGWRARHPELMARRPLAMALQIGLGLVTGLALLCLLLAVPYGLLSQPDMHVTGNQSWGNTLRWFADRSADGVLPAAGAVTLPLWCYKAAILLWSLWLANALLRWLRWTWASLNAGGVWPQKPTRTND